MFAFGVFAWIIVVLTFFYSNLMILILEKKFIRYVENNNSQIKENYENFHRGGWLKILRFIRLSEEVDDPHIKVLYEKIFNYEKACKWSLMVSIIIFFAIFFAIKLGVIK